MSEFHCGCPVCAANWGLITGLEARIDRLSEELDKEQAICRTLEERVAELIILQASAIRRHKDQIEALQNLKPLQRIDALEAALRNIAECAVRPGTAAYELQQKARRALEGRGHE
jgi:hypothetical protein